MPDYNNNIRRGAASSLDIYNPYPKGKSTNASSYFMNSMEDKKINESKLINIPPVDFFIEHFDLVEKLSKIINAKYGNKILMADQRSTIEAGCYNDAVQLFIDEGLYCAPERVPQYVSLFFMDILGLGMIEPLLNDPTVDEIMVKSHDMIYVERFGKIQLTEYRFPTVENAIGIIKKIITPLNLHIDAAHPNVNAQLPDGSRLSASIPPLRARGEVSITIRKFKEAVDRALF